MPNYNTILGARLVCDFFPESECEGFSLSRSSAGQKLSDPSEVYSPSLLVFCNNSEVAFPVFYGDSAQGAIRTTAVRLPANSLLVIFNNSEIVFAFC